MSAPCVSIRLTAAPLNTSFFNVPLGCRLEFLADGLDVRELSTNYASKDFVRSRFTAIEWHQRSRDPVDRVAVLHVTAAGAFDFSFAYMHDGTLQRNEGAFVVDPDVQLNGKRVPLDSLAIQTVLPRCLGPLDEWSARLAVAANSGYNAVHFTPVQAIGESGSAYSLRDQLSLDPTYFPGQQPSPVAQLEALEKTVKGIRAPREEGGLGLLCMVDIVLNHTAADSPWIREHPDAAYNLDNSPHLKPAYVLDETLQQSGRRWARPSPDRVRTVSSEHDLNDFIALVRRDFIPKAKLWEFFVADVETSLSLVAARARAPEGAATPDRNCFVVVANPANPNLHFLRARAHNRWDTSIDADAALRAYPRQGGETADQWIARTAPALRRVIEDFNLTQYQQLDEHVNSAFEQLVHTLRWQWLDARGPGNEARERIAAGVDVAVVQPYFSRLVPAARPIDEECPLTGVPPARIVAHNGWVWNADPLVDFGSAQSHAYLRRQVIVWTDSVKLFYGSGPDDNPYLWQRMFHYAESMGRLFDGLRIDNCHSTPLHVGQAMVDRARAVNPRLFTIAELFTGSIEKDNMFASKLGLTALIREAANANTPNELVTSLHRFGGRAVGSFQPLPSAAVPVVSTMPRALFMDCSHDNETPSQRSTTYNSLPLAALTAIGFCMSGSTRGFDELVATPVRVVGETRRYRSWGQSTGPTTIGPDGGILAAKCVLNRMHEALAASHTEIYLHRMSDDVVSITRHDPRTLRAVVLVTRLAFSTASRGPAPSLTVEGCVARVPLLWIPSLDYPLRECTAANDLVGGQAIEGSLHLDRDPGQCPGVTISNDGHTVDIHSFPAGAVAVFEILPSSAASRALAELTETLGLSSCVTTGRSPVIPFHSLEPPPALVEATAEMSLIDLNYALYRCEEEDQAPAYGVYRLPDYGPLPFCGLQGAMSVLEGVIAKNDLGHAICRNLREGTWLLSFQADRLALLPGCAALCRWLHRITALVSALHKNVVPAWAAAVIALATRACEERALSVMSPFARDGGAFVRRLALSSVQLYGLEPPLHLAPGSDGALGQSSLAAGLTHFSAGWMRSWGRDTFVALRGLLLLPGRFDDAKALIVRFGANVRHGLICNLLDNGNNPRFNARDAAWWFLQSVQDYCAAALEGVAFLSTEIHVRFVSDDEHAPRQLGLRTVGDTVQHILQRHAEGISFREWRAGPQIDECMHPDGFNVTARLDPETGFVSGGSALNCGTWMDKNGSSARAGNRGYPATPRDGAAVEITALVYSTVRWLSELHARGDFKHAGVALKAGGVFTYADWAARLAKSFEEHFYVPLDASEDGAHHCRTELVNKRGIYKDTFGASTAFADYQLRPNAALAMAIAPALFEPGRARHCLRIMQRLLVGPLGMRTLDPEDWAYRPNYLQHDSDDRATACGYNYHQGPEWLWPLGYFLRAYLHFSDNESDARAFVARVIAAHRAHIVTSPYKGLPELCNENGSFCPGSCVVQAWSMSSMLEVCWDLFGRGAEA